MTTPLEVIIITPQFDPFKEPVFYRWRAKDPEGLLAQVQGRSTTQTDLGALLNPDVRAALDAAGFSEVYWGDEELAADLVAFLATMGVTAVVVDPDAVETPPQEQPAPEVPQADGPAHDEPPT